MSDNKEVLITVKDKGRVVANLKTTQFPVVFGRSNECQIVLKNYDFISRTHGSITFDGSIVRVYDLNSRNGIQFKGEKNLDFNIERKDKFNISDLEFEIQIDAILSEEATIKAEDTSGPMEQKDSIVVFQANKADRPILPSAPQNADGSQYEFLPEDVSIDFSILPLPEVFNKKPSDLCLQAVVSWGSDIFDVRNFYIGDPILLGGGEESPIYIPYFEKKQKKMGYFGTRGGNITLSENLNWVVFSDGKKKSNQELFTEKRITKTNTSFLIILATKEVLSVDIGHGVFLHFRYVIIPRPLVKKTWIENREEFKKSIWTSGIIHLIASLFALFSAPKIDAPKIPNVPDRIAKLIVEPPPQILAPTPPPPPPEPPPEPEPPPVEKPKEEAPPPEPKPIPVKKIKKPAMVVPEKTVEQVKQDRSDKVITEKKVTMPPVPQTPPTPSKNEQSLANLFNKTPPPSTGGFKLDSKDFKMAMNTNSKNNFDSKGFGNINNALKKQIGQGGSAGPGFGSGNTPNLGAIGFSQGNSSSKTGRRGVLGAVVGAPKIVKKLDSDQGLSNEEVMKVVNRYLGDVQRCYERSLFSDPALVGRIEYEWDISSTGSVTGIRIKRSEMPRADSLNECVMTLFKKMKFPASKNGLSTIANIGFPFGKN